MPVSGALSRGAVNHASGVETTFGGVYTGKCVYNLWHEILTYFFNSLFFSEKIKMFSSSCCE